MYCILAAADGRQFEAGRPDLGGGKPAWPSSLERHWFYFTWQPKAGLVYR